MQDDLYLIEPELWFGVLCEDFGLDPAKRIDLRRVFNRWHASTPAGWEGSAPIALMRTLLAVGYSHGVGTFEASITLEDVEGHVLWRRSEPWTFTVGPGDAASAILVERVEYFFRDAGNYYYVVRLAPGNREDRIRFEVIPPQPEEQPREPAEGS